MSLKYRMHGYSKIEIGDCGVDGAMGTVLTEVKAIVPDSVVMEILEPELTEIFVEDQDEPDILDVSKGGLKTINFSTRDVKTDNLELFFGGSAAGTKWSSPVRSVKKFQSVKLTGKYVDGNAIEISVPKVLMAAKLTGSLQDSESGIIEAGCKVSVPVGASIASTAQVIDGTTEKLDISNPRGVNGITITIRQHFFDILYVASSVEGEAVIKLAKTTASWNRASAIQTAIRALGTIGSTDFSDWEFTSDGWDGNAIGDVLGTPTDDLAGGESEVPLSPYQVKYLAE